MGPLLLLALQAAAQQPDVSIRATADAKSAKIEKKGTATATAHADPDGGSTATSNGNSASAHWELKADARIADPMANQPQATEQPQQR